MDNSLTTHDMWDPDTEMPEGADMPPPPPTYSGPFWVVYFGLMVGCFIDWYVSPSVKVPC